MKIFKLFSEVLLFFFILFISNSSGFQDNITVSDVLNLVQSNPTTPRIIAIGKKLLAKEAEINALKILIRTTINSDVYETFAELSKELVQLRIKITDQKTTKDHALYKTSISFLWKLYHSLAGKLISIRKILENFVGDFSINGIIQAIKKLQFKDAEDILDFNDKDESFIPLLVKDIYANNTGNVKILLDFVSFLSTISRSFLILETLVKEADFNGQFDLILTIDIIEILENEILTQEITDDQQYTAVKNFDESLRLFLKKYASDTMMSQMINKTFKYAPKLNIFLTKLYNVDDKLSNEIMFDVIDRVYGLISNKELLDNIYARCYIPQRQDAFVYIYEKMRNTNQLNTAIPTLAKYFYAMKKMKYYDRIENATRHKNFNSILRAFPQSVKLLYSAPSVCIKNPYFKEYLYAATDGFSYGDKQRYIFTWIPQTQITQGVWYIEHGPLKTDEIYFRNKDHNEYMYASEEHIFLDGNFKYVFTWGKKGQHIGNKRDAWILEIDGEKVRFRSVSNNWLLCATSYKFDESRRNVHTVNDNYGEWKKSCSWLVETCD